MYVQTNPLYNPSMRGLGRARARRRLRGLGQFDVVPVGLLTSWIPSLAAPGPPAPVTGDISTGSLIWNWLSSGAGISEGCYPWDFTCANRGAMIQAGQAHIQNVADNACYYYGANSPSCVTATQAAAVQAAQVPQDVATITADNLPVGPAGIPTWIWFVLGGAGLFLVYRVVK